MDVEKAVEFVRRKGNEKEIERLDCILEDRKAETRFVEELMRLQNYDGGFPLDMGKGKPSALMPSGFVLRQMDDFNMLQSDIAKKVASFFFAVQEEDGSWNESEAILAYNPPPWMNPKDVRVRILSTAYVGFWLAKLGYSKDGRVKEACGFLARHRKENGALEGFRHTTWIGVSLFAMVHGKGNAATREGLEYLAGIAEDQWAPSQIAWLLWCLGSAKFPKDNRFMKHFLNILLKNQNPNGSFTSEDGPEFSVNATLEAMKVHRCFGFL